MLFPSTHPHHRSDGFFIYEIDNCSGLNVNEYFGQFRVQRDGLKMTEKIMRHQLCTHIKQQHSASGCVQPQFEELGSVILLFTI